MTGSTTWRRGRTLAAAVLAALALAGCTPLTAFDALVPKDRGSTRVAADIAYGSGPRQRLDVYAPRGGPGGAHPVVVFFYGGSWSSGDRAGYAFVGRALAARGFVAVVPDYRLVPQVRYPAFVEDGAAAVRWARHNAARYGGASDRIVLMGHSAGAYIAAMLAVDARWLGPDRAAVRGLIGLAGPYDFAPFDVEASQAAFGAWPRPAETQPVTWAGTGDPPALLAYGTDDQAVQPRNSEALAAKLRAGGVPVTLRAYPEVGHVGLVLALARPFRGRAPVLDDSARFVLKVARQNVATPASRMYPGRGRFAQLLPGVVPGISVPPPPPGMSVSLPGVPMGSSMPPPVPSGEPIGSSIPPPVPGASMGSSMPP